MMPPEVEPHGIVTVAPEGTTLGMAELLRIPKALLLLAKPGIVSAELLAGLAGALLALPAPPAAIPLCLALLCLAMAASGAAMANGLLDRGPDRKMARLARRSHALATAGSRLVLGMTIVLIGGAVTVAIVFFNLLTLLLLTAACFCYIVVYTGWLKRLTPWSVLAGGIPGALPPLVVAAAVSNSIPLAVLLLGVIIYIWQLPHFWFLALHFRDQYRLAGIPVLPLVHGERSAKIFTFTLSAALLPCTLAFGLSAHFSSLVTAMLLVPWLLLLTLGYRYLYRSINYRNGFITSIACMNGTLLLVIGSALLRLHP